VTDRSESLPADLDAVEAVTSYPEFLWKAARVAVDGGLLFYAWMTALTAVWLVGVNAWTWQLVEGQGVTAMTDHVSWGMYIGNFTYAVGIAAGAVMMVIPAYLYGDEDMHDVVIVGEVLAIAAIAVALSFVNVDLGRVDRIWHMMPIIGRFNWPISMLTWDVVVLSGYALINLHVVGYLLYCRFLGVQPDKRWYLPFVLLSVVWAVSIHTVTAFLYSGLGGRPFWNTAILAPRFIVSAFVTGPAFIVLALQVLRHIVGFQFGDGAFRTLLAILKVTMLVNLFLLGSELFTLFYTGGAHSASATYLWFGLHGKAALVPWIWTSLALDVFAAIVFLWSRPDRRTWLLLVACAAALLGIWIEKGLGLIVPGFVPSTLHEVVEYLPNQVEWKISLGIWAMGLMIYTVGIKVALAVFSGRMHHERSA
jgi:molybdopterin-containing oxidoreductase family membrane subunit